MKKLEDYQYLYKDIKLIDGKLPLRTLSDMTYEEMEQLENVTNGEYSASAGIANNIWTPTEFIYLLSKHFDLFGLIDSGQALDKTKL